MTFETLGLRPEILTAVQELGFTTPTSIQAAAIPHLITGTEDFLGLARTGTGKTAAFGLPLLERIDPKLRHIQAVILCPTRELCLQIAGDLKSFSRHLKDVSVVAVYGGAGIVPQMRALRAGAQVVVATPGRLIDLMNRKAARLETASLAVLDEADEMLNMGFQEDIDTIIEALPTERRIWLFSATMPPSVAAIASRYLDNPKKIKAETGAGAASAITHVCHVVTERDRQEALKRILDYRPDIYGLVFCRTREETRNIAELLLRSGYPAEALHGDLAQNLRDAVMRKFRNRHVRILVATDVAARGIDVDDITHVIHYNLPDELETYTHRSGRTARAGKTGTSIAIVSPREIRRVRDMERRINIRMEMKKLPAATAICERQIESLGQKFANDPSGNTAMETHMSSVEAAFADVSREELIRRLVGAEIGGLLSHYENARTIDAEARPPKSRWESGKPGPRNRMRTERLYINIGRLDKINEGTIVRLVCDQTGLRSRSLGKIDLKRECAFFEVEATQAGKVRQALRDVSFAGRKLSVRKATPPPHRGGPRRPHRPANAAVN